MQRRWVKCRVLLSFTRAQVDLPDEECDGEEKPPQQRQCELESCTGSPAPPQGRDRQHGPQWGYRKFSPCSKSCGGGEHETTGHTTFHRTLQRNTKTPPHTRSTHHRPHNTLIQHKQAEVLCRTVELKCTCLETFPACFGKTTER